MKAVEDIQYDIVRTSRRTADIVIERDGRVMVRAPKGVEEQRIRDIVQDRRLWIYKNLAEWRDLNATRVLREYRNGEGFLYLGRSYRLLLVADQEDALLLKNGRFCLRRDLVDKDGIPAAQAAFRDYYIRQGLERVTRLVQYFAPKVGVKPGRLDVRELGHRWASCSPKGVCRGSRPSWPRGKSRRCPARGMTRAIFKSVCRCSMEIQAELW